MIASASRFAAVAALAFLTGCSSIHYMSNSSAGSELSSQQKASLQAKKSAVPCRVEIICPSDMAGKYDSFFSSAVCHYPLEQVLEQCFSNAVYCAFEQPGGEVLDAFTLKVEVYKSELSMDSSEAVYSVSLNLTFEEPGEKKVTSFSIEKTITAPMGEAGPKAVPAAVYEAIKAAAIDSIAKLRSEAKVIKTVKRFEKK